jgi:hypothetical protein
MKSGVKAAARKPGLEAVAIGAENGIFAPLIVEWMEAGAVVRRVEIPDPREAYLAAFNRQYQPVSRATSLANSKRDAE